jgi:crossover junction endodeoxyribonuclease RuvC
MLMPTMKVGSATRVNAAALADWIYSTEANCAKVEQVGAMPGQGVSSMFNFGHSCGTIMGVLAAVGTPHTLVTPQAWKKSAGLIGTDKDASRARAIQLWPHWRELDKKGVGQALADAALIAKHGS